LDHIPVLDQNVILDAHNVRGNPIHRSTETANSPVHDHEVSLSDDRSGLVFQGWWDALDEIEETVAARLDMSAVLNVVRGPVPFGRCVVPFVEESVKGDTPTVELVLGYKKSNESPILKLLLSRSDELVARVSKKTH
jgi:hypothetical protein